MVKIIDRRKISLGGRDKRVLNRIKNIAVHYSATATGSSSAFESYWKNTKKWNTGGYHEVVLVNGDVELNYDANTISNGVGGQNTSMYNICYVGNGVPNAKQLKSLTQRVNYNRKRLNVSIGNIKGHREFNGQSTACPALNMNTFRSNLTNPNNTIHTSTPKPSKPVNSSQSTSKANLTADGYLGKLTIKALQRYFKTPVDGVISKPSVVIKSLQRLLKVNQDGYMGKVTITAMQRRFGTVQDGRLSKPSLVIKELQHRLNRGKL